IIIFNFISEINLHCCSENLPFFFNLLLVFSTICHTLLYIYIYIYIYILFFSFFCTLWLI
ncbi:MAG: hypothetical protein N7Q72_05035, partial [Spiroplasma sp. Tabriz.8]|nr:hypothetical protein [Spiroplasma sp. Tabriz.8]